MHQLEEDNHRLRQAASKRSLALAQARQFIDSNLQRSATMLQESSDSARANGAKQENGVKQSNAAKQANGTKQENGVKQANGMKQDNGVKQGSVVKTTMAQVVKADSPVKDKKWC